MLNACILFAFAALHLALLTSAQKTVSIWLSASEQNDVGPLYTVTVGQEDYTFPDYQPDDHRQADKLVWETIPKGDWQFAKAGHMTFDNEAPKDVNFWVRAGDKNTPTRDMTRCLISLSGSEDFAADGEMKLYLAPKGEFSMFEGQFVQPNWLTCQENNLFEVPVALTEDD